MELLGGDGWCFPSLEIARVNLKLFGRSDRGYPLSPSLIFPTPRGRAFLLADAPGSIGKGPTREKRVVVACPS